MRLIPRLCAAIIGCVIAITTLAGCVAGGVTEERVLEIIKEHDEFRHQQELEHQHRMRREASKPSVQWT